MTGGECGIKPAPASGRGVSRVTVMVRYAALGAFSVMWIGGLGTYLTADRPPDHLAWTPPVFLALAAMTLLAWAPPGWRMPIVHGGAVGWIAEVVGVHTSFPFGAYRYGEVLGPSALGAPLAIGAAWGVFAAYGAAIATRLARGAWIPVVGAIWLVGLDLVVDPPASSYLGFWAWDGQGAYYGVPLTNYAGWFAVGMLACLPVARARRSTALTPGAAEAVGLSLLVFFTLICFTKGLVVPGAVGAGLCAAHALLARRCRAGGGNVR